jgi:AP endonuclease-1
MLSRQSSGLSSAPSIAPDGTPELATVVKGTIEASSEVKIQGKKRKAATSKQSTKRAKTTVTTESIKHEADVEASLKSTQKKARKTKVSTTTGATVEGEDQENDPKLNGATTTKIPRKRKTKEEKAAEAMPLRARTVGSKLLVGAHVSAAGGTYTAS